MSDSTFPINPVSKDSFADLSLDNGSQQDTLTLQQLELIQKDIAGNQPMISNEAPVNSLKPIYLNADNSGYLLGIEYLSQRFRYMRKIRGDGNCFYRALLFGYLENLLNLYASGEAEKVSKAKAELARIERKIQGSMQELVEIGYPEFAIECFHEEMVDILKSLFEYNNSSLLEMFQEGGRANSLTWYMRVLTAGYLKRDPDRFLPFVEGLYFDMDSFCKAEVEPMNKECEQIQIIALTEYLGIFIDIAYLDGRPFDESVGLSFVAFPDESSIPSDVITYLSTGADNSSLKNELINHLKLFQVHLLYRPGHYDVIYE